MQFEAEDEKLDSTKDLGGVLENLPAAAVSEAKILCQSLAARALMSGVEVTDVDTLDRVAGIPEHKVRAMLAKDPSLKGGLAQSLASRMLLPDKLLGTIIKDATEFAMEMLRSPVKGDLVKGTGYFSGLSCRVAPRAVYSAVTPDGWFASEFKKLQVHEGCDPSLAGQEYDYTNPKRFSSKVSDTQKETSGTGGHYFLNPPPLKSLMSQSS